MVDALSGVWTVEHDGTYRTSTDPSGNSTVEEFNFREDTVKFTDQLGNVTEYVFNITLGKLDNVTNALGDVTQYFYNVMGFMTSIVDANGHWTNFTYDSFARLKTVVLPLGLIIWGFLATGITPLLDNLVAEAWFSWLPEWFFIFDLSQLGEYARPVLMLTFIIGLIVNGFALPFVEELYFRGYLLPRLERFGKWAPLINVSLFSLYHFWTPWQFISRVLWLPPWVYTTWRKQNIYLMMIAHCAANTLGWLLIWGLILGQ